MSETASSHRVLVICGSCQEFHRWAEKNGIPKRELWSRCWYIDSKEKLLGVSRASRIVLTGTWRYYADRRKLAEFAREMGFTNVAYESLDDPPRKASKKARKK